MYIIYRAAQITDHRSRLFATTKCFFHSSQLLNKNAKIYTVILTNNKNENKPKTKIMCIIRHRSVITASIFILGITLCDFHLRKSVTQRTVLSSFLLCYFNFFSVFFCLILLHSLPARKRKNRTQKKNNAN